MESKTQTGLTGKARETLTQILTHVVADESLLSATTKRFGWSITGPHFHSLNKLFEEQRRQLDYWLDRVMDRARALGAAAIGREAPNPGPAIAAAPRATRTMILELLTLHEETARKLQADLRECDDATADVLRRLIEFHETSAWMLRMLLEGPEGARFSGE